MWHAYQASLGAHAVVTDQPNIVMKATKENVDRNIETIKSCGNGGKVTILPLEWTWTEGDAKEFEEKFLKQLKAMPDTSTDGRMFDLIIGSDLIFHEKAINPLVSTVRRLLAAGGEFLMSHKNRKPIVRERMEKAFKDAGFVVEEMETRFKLFSIYRFTKDKSENLGKEHLPEAITKKLYNDR
eukprot:jgi/Bigna1/143525/aug1.79_g18233